MNIIAAIALALVVILSLLYIRHSLRTHDSMSITRAHLKSVDFDLLQERVPIVITDRVVDVNDLFSTIFKYQYAFKSVGSARPDTWVRNSHKYMVLKAQTTQQDTDLKLAHPKTDIRDGDYDYVDVVLRPSQVMIVPYGWWVCSSNMETYFLDDFASKMLSFVT